MTSERKTEVNRRLAEFDGMSLSSTHYTNDLNALARLEAKLPALRRIEVLWRGERIAVNLWIPTQAGVPKDGIYYSEWTTTESEGRAEAICQYLEQRYEGIPQGAGGARGAVGADQEGEQIMACPICGCKCDCHEDGIIRECGECDCYPECREE